MYFSMDVMENYAIKDLRNPKNEIQFNYSTMNHLKRGIVNRALCVKYNESDVILLKKTEICSGEDCFFTIWLRHHCNSNNSIFLTPTFSIFCSENDTTSIKIFVQELLFSCSSQVSISGII